jgi:hypothetical protein
MINYLVTARHTYTVSLFLQTWPNSVRDIFRIVPYDSLPAYKWLRSGAFIVSDIDRLRPLEFHGVERLCDLISSELASSLVLNHPRRVLLRRALLQTLWEKGINSFRIFPFGEHCDPIRYPVFMRGANDHNGSLTDIIYDVDQHRRAIAQIASKVADTSDIITVEFCDTRGADGLYRKFSAFRVGDIIVPGHVLFSSDWITKDSPPEPLREEERAYLADNPHREALTRIFDLAGITYGRIDYGLLSGKIQVWEINTNPTLIQEREKYAADKLAAKQQLVDRLSDALIALDHADDARITHCVRVPAKLFPIVGLRPRTRLRRMFSQRVL